MPDQIDYSDRDFSEFIDPVLELKPHLCQWLWRYSDPRPRMIKAVITAGNIIRRHGESQKRLHWSTKYTVDMLSDTDSLTDNIMCKIKQTLARRDHARKQLQEQLDQDMLLLPNVHRILRSLNA